MNAVEVELDRFGRVEVVNDTGVAISKDDLERAIGNLPSPVLDQMATWTRKVTAESRGRRGGLWQRDQYLAPRDTFEQIRTARKAVEEDDAVSGTLDLTESLAFKRMGFFHEDLDEQDVWNQWAGTVNLDWLLRAAWRQHFTDSHAVFAMWWDRVTYTPRGTGQKGHARRKQFTLDVPTKIDLLDTLKVTPVGPLLFGRHRLAYIATAAEAEAFDWILREEEARRTRFLPSGAPIPDPDLPAARRGRAVTPRPRNRPISLRWLGEDPSLDDPVVHRLIVRRYEPDPGERAELVGEGIDPTFLYLLDDSAVFRHTATKPGYKRFADIRMRSAFDLLDMKHQLRQRDRVHLIGGINFIVLITQGSDKQLEAPGGAEANEREIAHLRANATTIAQVPILVGSHTLDVKIVTPSQDVVLQGEKYDTLDERIKERLLRQFRPGSTNAETSVKDTAQLAGHWLENERLMLRRTVETSVLSRILARNRDELESGRIPTLQFSPQRIALSFDPALASFFTDLYDGGDLSRESLLGQFELDQAREARMRERERDQYDNIFRSAVPFNSPGNNPRSPNGQPTDDPNADPNGGGQMTRSQQRRAGRKQGGRNNGGGAAPGSGQGQSPRNVRRLADGAGHRELMATARTLEIRGRSKMTNRELDDAIGDALDVIADDEDDIEEDE